MVCRDSWDLKRCSPLAAAAFISSRIAWSIQQFQKDRQEQFEEIKERLGLNDDSVEFYADPQDPYTVKDLLSTSILIVCCSFIKRIINSNEMRYPI